MRSLRSNRALLCLKHSAVETRAPPRKEPPACHSTRAYLARSSQLITAARWMNDSPPWSPRQWRMRYGRQPMELLSRVTTKERSVSAFRRTYPQGRQWSAISGEAMLDVDRISNVGLRAPNIRVNFAGTHATPTVTTLSHHGPRLALSLAETYSPPMCPPTTISRLQNNLLRTTNDS
uniref:Uncharacterized protein n=1 Tax=Paenarthrobacter nicotinovorans TaxID=29320 RepID=Q8GAI9_PAENI|nr:hypothetical protein [Paenarthrobacter nicotinovorans]